MVEDDEHDGRDKHSSKLSSVLDRIIANNSPRPDHEKISVIVDDINNDDDRG